MCWNSVSSVEQYGGTLVQYLMEQWNSVSSVEQCGAVKS